MSDRTTATTISIAKPRTHFVKTTVPQWLVKQLKLNPGDKFEWELAMDDDGWYVKLRPKYIDNTKE